MQGSEKEEEGVGWAGNPTERLAAEEGPADLEEKGDESEEKSGARNARQSVTPKLSRQPTPWALKQTPRLTSAAVVVDEVAAAAEDEDQPRTRQPPKTEICHGSRSPRRQRLAAEAAVAEDEDIM